MKKTALVIGATGLIGRALVDELLSQDTIGKVITLTRRPLIVDRSSSGGKDRSNKCIFENYPIDFSKLEHYQEYFQQVDMFFSCLGTTKKAAGTIKKQKLVDLDYQYKAAEIAYYAGVEHYYLVSSSGASTRSLSPYLKMKGELENKVMALGFKRFVIFRPSLLLGERTEKRSGEFFAGKVMPLLSYIPILNKYRPIRGIEVAKKMAMVANQDIKREYVQSVKFYTLDEIFINH